MSSDSSLGTCKGHASREERCFVRGKGGRGEGERGKGGKGEGERGKGGKGKGERGKGGKGEGERGKGAKGERHVTYIRTSTQPVSFALAAIAAAARRPPSAPPTPARWVYCRCSDWYAISIAHAAAFRT
eukprot:360784-Chlamydomonas_euryale.AAC.4